jgi:release factor glutamine methyltransferase
VQLRRLLSEARLRLAANDDPAAAPALEAELLLGRVIDASRAHLFAHPEAVVSDEDVRAYRELVARRARGEPLAYITGEQEFWSLTLAVNESVLIPRPETEHLVELALERLPAAGPVRVADIGTGSGAIALALGSERPAAEVHAVDISAGALATARGNATRLGIGNVTFQEGRWCEPLTGRFDMIVSNPPYVDENDAHLDRGDLRFEPRLALTPGADPLSAFRAIAAGAAERLDAGGWLLFEHGFEQGEAVRGLLTAAGWRDVETHKDLAGRERVTLARKTGP